MLNPLPVQNFADDITIVTHDARSLHEMIKVSEPIKKRADLDVKSSRCTVLYRRRSGNNRYTGKMIKSQILLSKTKTSRY